MKTPATEPEVNTENALRPLSVGGNFAALSIGAASILLGAFLMLVFPVGILGSAVCFVVGTVACAMLFAFGRGAWRVTVFAAVAATVFYADVLGACFGLSVVVAAILLAIGAIKKQNRFEVGAGQTLAVSLITALGVAAVLYQATGSVGVDAIAAVSDSVIDTLIPFYEEYVEELAVISPDSELVTALSDTVAVEKMLRSILNLLPAYFGAVVTCFCYLTTVFFSRRAERTSRTLPSLRMFAVPTALALPFLLTLTVGFFFSDESVAGLALEYVSVLLTPCFAYVGLSGVWQMIKTKFSPGARVVAVVIGLVLAVSVFGYALTVLALYGAFFCLRAGVTARMGR